MLSSRPVVVTVLVWISFQTAATTGSAQIPRTGARAAALGGASIGLEGEDGIWLNPAAISTLDRASATFGFGRPFGISELDGTSVDVAAPIGSAIVSLGLRGIGFEAFSETELSAGLAGSVRGIGAGLRLKIARRKFDRYGADSRFAFDAGWKYPLAPGLVLGTSILNVGLGSGGVRVAAGLTARTADRLLTAVSAVMGKGVAADVRFGFEMKLVDALALRLGGATSPGLATTGVGLFVKRLTVDVAIALHARLGLSPVITVRFVK